MPKSDIIIIGAGHNGLVAATYLAKAGLKPLVLERRDISGGACVTEEIHPGFRCSTLADSAGLLLPQIVRDLQFARRGLDFIRRPVRVLALNPNAAPLCIYEDAKRAADSLATFSTKDAHNYPGFLSAFARIGKALQPLLTMTPPDIDAPSKGELWQLGKLGWGIRGLGRKNEYRLLRYGPMAVADLAAEWFESEPMRALVAARGIFGAFAGPWSAGTCAPLLLQAAMDGHAIAPSTFAKDGLGALTQALSKAASEAGAEIRTHAEVANILVRDGSASGVALSTGEEIAARAVISNADPRATFLRMTDPSELDPSFLHKIHNYRAHGTVARVHLALSALPNFSYRTANDSERDNEQLERL